MDNLVLIAAQMSTCAVKCFKAFLSTENKLPRSWMYTIFADLVPHLAWPDSRPNINHQPTRFALAIVVELVEKRPRDEGIARALNFR
jgi:hypothetical protein